MPQPPDHTTPPEPTPGTLRVQPGTAAGPSINPAAVRRRRPALSLEALQEGVKAGDRTVLGRAITLVESTQPAHRETAQALLAALPAPAEPALRIGITGVPGVGKSTFIEAFGSYLTGQAHRVAVLAIDPSSTRTHGSILGDKTRMPRLAADPRAFIRPSPTGGALGGVARTTHETIRLCEAAGFDLVIVETVGVGQSEVAVEGLVDVVLLLMLAGAGDELQGIKRGIVETADVVAITKADGDNVSATRQARAQLQSALRLFPRPAAGLTPRVLTCSALTGDGLEGVWEALTAYRDHVQATGYFTQRRSEQAQQAMHHTIQQALADDFAAHPSVRARQAELEADVAGGRLSPFEAAQQLLKAYHTPRDRP